MTKIVAEVGKNFVSSQKPEPLNTLAERAKKLIDAAKESGADVVKFQTHFYEDEIHPKAKIKSPHFDQDRYEWVKRNTYPASFWRDLRDYCFEKKIEFLSTPMSRGAAEMLNEEVGVNGWKIGSGDILDFPMLDYIRDTGRPVILSSGMSIIQELTKAYEYLKEKTPDVSVMHCVSIYPCPLESLNLNTIPFLQKKFPDASIGFSDHSLGIEGALMAVSLGAEIIEKHFTLDRNAWGPDHKVSLLPKEMKELIQRIKQDDLLEPTPEALGVPTKYIHQEEMQFRPVFHKGLYAAMDISEGQIIESEMIYAMRPKLPEAPPSEDYTLFVDAQAKRNYKKYEAL